MSFAMKAREYGKGVNQESDSSAHADLPLNENWRSQADGFYDTPDVNESTETAEGFDETK